MNTKKHFVMTYNEMYEPIGLVERRIANRSGLWHACVQVLIVNIAKKGSVFFQRRGSRKNVFPLKYDVSASGHVDEMELSIETAIKETYEELGLIINKDDLIYAGRRIDIYKNEEIYSRIFADVYFVIKNTNLIDFKYDDYELDGIIEIPITKGISFFSKKIKKIKCKGIRIDDKSKKHLIESIEINENQFITRLDKYYLNIFIAAKNLIEGIKTISI